MSILVGNDEIIAIGKKLNNNFLSTPEYMESGLLEYFVSSLQSQPPTEKFLYQNTRQETINSNEYRINIPKKKDMRNIR